eukprot:s1_g341.t1
MSRFFGEIRQNGYVVPDIEAAIDYWATVMGVGPWLYLEHAPIKDFCYKGTPSEIDVSIALANAGPLQIELIQQRNEAPSMYRDFVDAGHTGLQHVAYWTESFDKDLAAAETRGLTIGQSGAQAADNEVRIGVLNHEMSLFRGDTQEDGVDINLEVLFDSPEWLEWAWAPRPHVGATIATHDDATSFIYTGLTWDYNFWGPMFVEGSFGFALHDGETGKSTVSNELGCVWNFHESASLGYEVTEAHRVMLTFEHISNASLCSENEGISNVGVRYGYQF